VDVTTRRKILALLLVVSYLGLATLGAACLFGDLEPGHAASHHAGSEGGKPAHSPLCAWACQAGPSAVAQSANVVGPPTFPAFAVFVAVRFLTPSYLAASQRARAPPVVRL
jgi:hypothetical protein